MECPLWLARAIGCLEIPLDAAPSYFRRGIGKAPYTVLTRSITMLQTNAASDFGDLFISVTVEPKKPLTERCLPSLALASANPSASQTNRMLPLKLRDLLAAQESAAGPGRPTITNVWKNESRVRSDWQAPARNGRSSPNMRHSRK